MKGMIRKKRDWSRLKPELEKELDSRATKAVIDALNEEQLTEMDVISLSASEFRELGLPLAIKKALERAV